MANQEFLQLLIAGWSPWIFDAYKVSKTLTNIQKMGFSQL